MAQLMRGPRILQTYIPGELCQGEAPAVPSAVPFRLDEQVEHAAHDIVA